MESSEKLSDHDMNVEEEPQVKDDRGSPSSQIKWSEDFTLAVSNEIGQLY